MLCVQSMQNMQSIQNMQNVQNVQSRDMICYIWDGDLICEGTLGDLADVILVWSVLLKIDDSRNVQIPGSQT